VTKLETLKDEGRQFKGVGARREARTVDRLKPLGQTALAPQTLAARCGEKETSSFWIRGIYQRLPS